MYYYCHRCNAHRNVVSLFEQCDQIRSVAERDCPICQRNRAKENRDRKRRNLPPVNFKTDEEIRKEKIENDLKQKEQDKKNILRWKLEEEKRIKDLADKGLMTIDNPKFKFWYDWEFWKYPFFFFLGAPILVMLYWAVITAFDDWKTMHEFWWSMMGWIPLPIIGILCLIGERIGYSITVPIKKPPTKKSNP